MIYQEAIRILHPHNIIIALAEYEAGKEERIKVVEEACEVAREAMQRLIDLEE